MCLQSLEGCSSSLSGESSFCGSSSLSHQNESGTLNCFAKPVEVENLNQNMEEKLHKGIADKVTNGKEKDVKIHTEKSKKLNALDDDDDWEANIDALVEMVKEMKTGYSDAEFPIFMKDCPHDISQNAHLVALQELLYDPNDTPEQTAENFKNAGNEAYKEGKRHYKDAYIFYTKGIEINSKDKILNAALYSNRAHILLISRKYTECIDDCRKAIEQDPTNSKAYYRAAKASYCLGLYAQSKEFCDKGIFKTDEKLPFEQFMNDILSPYLKKLNTSKTKLAEEEQKTQQEEMKNKQKLESICKFRGIRLVEERYEMAKGASFQAYVDDEEAIHWPVILLYDEIMISDMIVDVNENDKLEDQMRIVFSENSFPAPNKKHQYKHNNISIFYEGGTITDEIMFKVSNEMTLKEIVNAVKIVAGVPVLHILVKGSAGEDLFVKQNRIEKLPLSKFII